MRDKIADNREDTAKHGRRATDYIKAEKVLSQHFGFSRMRIFGGFMSLGIATALFTGGLNNSVTTGRCHYSNDIETIK